MVEASSNQIVTSRDCVVQLLLVIGPLRCGKIVVMLLRLCIAASLLAGLAPRWLRADDNQLTPEEKKAGWILLFDGRSFDNWEDPTRKSPPGDSFSIEDGCLKATAHPKFEEDLFSTRTWGDFDLQWDWKIAPRGNSGLKYRIQDRIWVVGQTAPRFEDKVNAAMRNRPTARPDRGQDYVIGFEYQMTDDGANSDCLHSGPRHCTAALYDNFAAVDTAPRPVGEFNHSELVVRGKHVEHWLNGRKVLDARLDAPEIAAGMAKRWGEGSPVYDLLVNQPRARCPISLQNHGDNAWFKNIKIRPLN
jgi:3-keto-disaccharide hydrolase